MTDAEYKAQLRNAIRHKVDALTVVEIESRYRAEKLIEELKPFLAERPHETIFFPEPNPSAGIFLKAAHDAIRSWTPGEGVLFLVDAERIQPADFWREMNSYRESWGALGCHVVFFLAPGNYQLLIQVADHLADWMPLKLHILGEEDRILPESVSQDRSASVFGPQLSPKVAREQLEVLQIELDEALQSGIPQTVLVRRYYLPLFQAALATGNLGRAEAIRGHIREEDVAESEKVDWFELNYSIDLSLYRLPSAEEWARRLLDLGKKNEDDGIVATAYHQLGIIAGRRRDLDAAEQWYRKSLDISGRLGDESGMASTYHQLGMIAGQRRDLDAAEQWYRKSIEIKERLGDESGMAKTYHQLGLIAGDRRDLDAAEQWYRKSIEIKERLGDEFGLALTLWVWGGATILAGKLEDTATHFSDSYAIFVRLGDGEWAGYVKNAMVKLYRQAASSMKPKIKKIAEQAGIELPSEDEPPPHGEDAAG